MAPTSLVYVLQTAKRSVKLEEQLRNRYLVLPDDFQQKLKVASCTVVEVEHIALSKGEKARPSRQKV